MAHALRRILCLVLVLLSHPLAAQVFTKSTTPWPDFPTIPKAKLSWVGDDMRVNGLPTKILTFDSEESREAVIANVSAQWRASRRPASEAIVAAKIIGKDLTLGRPHGPFFMLVRAKSAGQNNSQGTISISQILGVEPKLDASSVFVPSDARALSVVESADLGKKSKQVLFSSEMSLISIKQYYSWKMNAEGWTPLQVQDSSISQGAESDGFVVMFQKENKQFDVAVSYDPSSRSSFINANIIEWSK